MNFLVIVSLMLLSRGSAHAAEPAIHCTLGAQQGSATLEALRVEGHPELLLYRLDVISKIARSEDGKTTHQAGHLVGELISNREIFLTGLLFDQPDSDLVADLGAVTLRGDFRPEGGLSLHFYDSNRVLQLGFGVAMRCR